MTKKEKKIFYSFVRSFLSDDTMGDVSESIQKMAKLYGLEGVPEIIQQQYSNYEEALRLLEEKGAVSLWGIEE